MIVECPNCSSKFNLPDENIPESGAKVRCSQCRNVFEVKPPSDEDENLAELLDQDEPPAEGAAGSGDLDLDFDGKGKKTAGGGKKLLLPLIVLLLLGGAAAVYFTGMYVSIPYVGPMLEGTAGEEEATGRDKVKLIVLENVRQYYVDNEKAGRLFVVEGSAVNQFERPKEFIKVEVTLFDDQGSPLQTRQVLCGNTLTLFQLQVLSRSEIEASLASEMGVLNDNTNLATGDSVPFLIVFFEPPEEVAEFGVRVVDAQDVEQGQ
jgi:predicted Zn finger-like uncharacterized protein